MNLEEENIFLKNKVNELTIVVSTLENKMNELKRKQDYVQMIIALNDSSICFSLGYKLKNSSFKILNEDARIYGHYIDNLNDSGEIKRAKMIVLYEKIKNMDNYLHEKINELYPNVIRDVVMELIHVNTKESAHVMKRVYEWWN
jgi:hypothetical protein